ncbi:MAG: phosphate ABC transporter permease subunit PstC [Bacillota bacterium]
MKKSTDTGAGMLSRRVVSGRLRRSGSGLSWERGLLLACAGLVIVLTVSIIVFISTKGLATFLVNRVSPAEFLLSTEWAPDRPAEQGGPRVGGLPYILGSVAVSVLAVMVATPLGLSGAVFAVEVAPRWGQRVLQPALEMLAGIPSVVYGWMGLTVLVPFVREHAGGLGFSLLAGFLVLSVMVLPTIFTVSADSLRALPPDLKEAAYALGSTRWQTIRRVLLPAARSGIIAGVVLGLARAFGEALAVQMVIGNTRKIPTSLLDPVTTLTSAITMDMPYTVMGSLWNNVLWSMALLLLLMSCGFIVAIKLIARRGVKL